MNEDQKKAFAEMMLSDKEKEEYRAVQLALVDLQAALEKYPQHTTYIMEKVEKASQGDSHTPQ